MAFMIKLLRAKTLDDLETAINAFFVETAKDVRIEVNLVGGVNFVDGEFVAPVSMNAPHKRSFE